MEKNNELKSIVKEKYADIAINSSTEESQGCGCGCSCEPSGEFTIMKDEYKNIEGYVENADLGLGCGLPTQYAGINIGDTVLDLGSGAGNDVFVARSIVGEQGRVIGIDMTEEMIEKAKINNFKLGFENVEFKLGDIEKMPLENDTIDVIVSNCVLNLVPDKEKAFKEIYRVLKDGGHFCVSDIVIKGELPEEVRRSAELYVGCVSGAINKDEYLKIIEHTGFRDVVIHTSKEINLPDSILKEFLDENKFNLVKKSGLGISSITVSGYKN